VNKKTLALTENQFKEIIETIRGGFGSCRPNNKIATVLVIEANLGLRIGDILRLKLSDIVKDGDRWRLDIKEMKTGKERTFTVPVAIYNYIKIYVLENGIGTDETMFPISERAVQKHLKLACDWLGFEGISTHSFRKFFATKIYNGNDHDIVLVQQLLQHSSTAVTQRYIGIQPKQLEEAIEKHICLM
jgi:integrase